MSDKFYDYSRSGDFGGEFSPYQFDQEIRASEITRALRNIQTDGDLVRIYFVGPADLSQANLDALQGALYPNPIGGLIAAHVPTIEGEFAAPIRQTFHVDTHRAQPDGHVVTAEASSWSYDDYSMPADLHLNEACVFFDGMKLGDYAFPCIINPAADCSLAVAAAIDDEQVQVPAGKPIFFDPANGAQHIEFWNSGMTQLLECRGIDGVDLNGALVLLSEPLVVAHDTTVKVRARYGSFAPVRGSAGIEGGVCLLGTDKFYLPQPYSMTDLIPSGMILSARLKTTSEAGTRRLATNYIFRTP